MPLQTILIDALLGPSSTGPLAERLYPTAEVYQPSSAPSWHVATYRAALTDILAQDSEWNLAVAFEWSAGIAAQLVLKRKAQRAVLIDPTLNIGGGLQHIEDLPDAAARVNHHIKEDQNEWIFEAEDEALSVMMNPNPSTASIERFFATYTKDPGRIAEAAFFKAQTEAWGGLHVRGGEPSPEDEEVVDWFTAMNQDPHRIEVWWSQPYAEVARILSEHHPQCSFKLQDWPEKAWLVGDPRIAEQLELAAPG